MKQDSWLDEAANHVVMVHGNDPLPKNGVLTLAVGELVFIVRNQKTKPRGSFGKNHGPLPATYSIGWDADDGERRADIYRIPPGKKTSPCCPDREGEI